MNEFDAVMCFSALFDYIDERIDKDKYDEKTEPYKQDLEIDMSIYRETEKGKPVIDKLLYVYYNIADNPIRRLHFKLREVNKLYQSEILFFALEFPEMLKKAIEYYTKHLKSNETETEDSVD